MVSSTPALPVYLIDSGNNDSPPAVSPEVGRENENAPSFAARLDQRLSRSEADNAARRSQARRPESHPGAKSLEPDSETPNTAAASAADSAPEPGDTDTSSDNSNSGNTRKDQKTRADTATTADSSAAPLPATNALYVPAIMASPAVTPTPVPVQTAALAVSTNLMPATQTSNSNAAQTSNSNAAQTSNSNATQTSNSNAAQTSNSSIAAQGVSVNAASMVPNAASANPAPTTATPIIPAVAMDSRAAMLNAAPGVDNAKPAPSLPNVTSAALPNDSTTLNDSVAAAITSITAPQNSSTAKVVSNTLREAGKTAVAAPAPAGLSPSSGAATISVPSAANSAIVNGITEAHMPESANASDAQSETQAPVALEQGKPSAALTGKQNLEGIERLLTLSNAKSAPIAAEAVTQTAEPSVPPALNSASVATIARPGFTGSLMGTRQGSLAGVNGAQSGMSALMNGTGETQAASPIALASSSLDSFGKTGAIVQALHGAPGVSELTHALSAPPLNLTGNGEIGDSIPLALGQAAMPANGDAGESEQGDSQSSFGEQKKTSGNEIANTAGSQSSAPFATGRNAGEVAAPTQAASPANGNQIDRARVVEQVTRHLETMRLTDAGGEMRLRLNPHNLGSVQVSIATHQDGVVARIAVESAQVQQAMEGAKEHLRAGLEARGLRVQSVEVTVTPNLPGDNSAAFSNQRNWQSANAQESAAGQANYGRRTLPQTEAAPAAPSAIIPPRVLSTDNRLDRRA